MSNASDDFDDLDSLTRARRSSAFLSIKSGFISCMIFIAWISSCSITSFYDGYQHLGLIPLRDHIVWFYVGVNVGLQRGLDVSRSLLLHILTCANRNEKLLNG